MEKLLVTIHTHGGSWGKGEYSILCTAIEDCGRDRVQYLVAGIVDDAKYPADPDMADKLEVLESSGRELSELELTLYADKINNYKNQFKERLEKNKYYSWSFS